MKTLHVKKCDGLLSKSKGLIGEKTPYPLYLKTRFGIHTFGVLFPLDVLILDESYTIVSCKKNLLPNRIFLWNPRYPHVIELPKGTITQRSFTQGEKIHLVYS